MKSYTKVQKEVQKIINKLDNSKPMLNNTGFSNEETVIFLQMIIKHCVDEIDWINHG